MDSIHLNFDLAIEETEDGYFTRVVDSPVGKGAARFVSPLSPQDIDQAWAALEASAGGRPGPDQPGLMRSVGRRLFKALFSDEVLNLYRASLRVAYQAQAGLRLHLDLSQAPAFEPLPWEYLYDPGRDEFLGLSIHVSVARHIDRMYCIDSYTVEPPLRVLVAVAEPDTYAQFDGERKWLDLIDAIDYLARDRRLLLERLKKPTLFELQRRLRQGEHHVFHFIGHGFLEPNSRDGLLVMEDEIGRGRTISGCMMPFSRIDSANSFNESSSNPLRGCIAPGRIAPIGTSLGESAVAGVFPALVFLSADGRAPSRELKPRPKPVFAMGERVREAGAVVNRTPVFRRRRPACDPSTKTSGARPARCRRRAISRAKR